IGNLEAGVAHINLSVPVQSARASTHCARRSAATRAVGLAARPRSVTCWRAGKLGVRLAEPPGTVLGSIHRPATRGCAASGMALAADVSGNDPDVFRLGSLLALGDVELDLLSFLQAAVAAAGDRAEVHEHVLAALDRDETVALLAVEPLHSALRHLDLLIVDAAPP